MRRHGTPIPEIIPRQKQLEVSSNKTGRLQVKIFGQGERTYPLCSEERGTNKQRLNRSLPKQVKTSLGPEREVLIAEKDKTIEEEQKPIQEDRGIADDENENRARERILENKSGLMLLRMREKNLKKARH